MDHYDREVAELTQWLARQLPGLGPVAVREGDRQTRVESLAGPHAELLNRAVYVWCHDHGYRLTPEQLNAALIDAALLAGVLVVT